MGCDTLGDFVHNLVDEYRATDCLQNECIRIRVDSGLFILLLNKQVFPGYLLHPLFAFLALLTFAWLACLYKDGVI